MTGADALTAAMAALVVGLAAMACLQVLARREPAAAGRWLLTLLGAAAVCAGGDVIRHLGAISLLRWSEPFSNAALLLPGPAAWLYVRELSRRAALRRRTIAWHLLPAVLVFLLSLASALLEPTPVTPDRRSADELISLLPVALQMLAYGIALVVGIGRLQSAIRARFSDISRRTLRWVLLVWLLYMGTLLLWVFTWQWPVALSNLATNALLAMVVLVLGLYGFGQASVAGDEDVADEAVVDPEPEAGPVPADGPRYDRARLTPEQVQDIDRRLDQVMTEDRAYLESDLTLGVLAARIGVTSHQLSQFLSLHRRQSFYDYVNGWRVEAVKATLRRPGSEGRSLLEIALECGFGSKSTFNAAFKRLTGSSPGAWRTRPTPSDETGPMGTGDRPRG